MEKLESLLENSKITYLNKELVKFTKSSSINKEDIKDWIDYCDEQLSSNQSDFYKSCKKQLENKLNCI